MSKGKKRSGARPGRPQPLRGTKGKRKGAGFWIVVGNQFYLKGLRPLTWGKFMFIIKTGAERIPHDLSHFASFAGQIGRLITISTSPVIAGDSFEMDAVGALRLSPLRRGLAIDSTVDIFTFYVPHRHVYGEQWIKFMKDGVNATPLPTVNTT